MKKVIAFILAAIMIFTLCACGQQEVIRKKQPVHYPNDNNPTARPADPPEPVKTPEPEAEEEAEEEVKIPELVGDYGVKLVDTLAEDGKNTVVSDMSVNMALCMILEGAEGEVKDQLEAYLGIKKEEAKDYNKYIVSLLNENEMDELKTAIANSLWMKENDIDGEYLQTLLDYYQAEVETVDFKDPETANKINQWCNEKTNELIPEIVQADAIKEMSAILVNALYFKANWIDAFGDADENGKFDGKKAPMMTGGADLYYENDQATAFGKRYYGGYQFIGILPKEEGAFTLADLDLASLLESETSEDDVVATMPKFKTDFEATFSEYSDQLGLNAMFQPDADFSGINPDFYVDEIIHKTVMSIDENGTEAAAVTAIMMKANGMMIEEEPEVKEVVLDRPFAFVIMDSEGHSLFTGKINTVTE